MGCAGSKDAFLDRRRCPPPFRRRLSFPVGHAHHVVSLTSSTLGSLKLDGNSESADEEMKKGTHDGSYKISDHISATTGGRSRGGDDAQNIKTPARVPSDVQEPETINEWELMDGLEDSISQSLDLESGSKSGEVPKFTGIVKARITAFQKMIDAGKKSFKISPLGQKFPPGGKGKLVFYFTSLRGVRKTYEDCRNLRLILQGYGVRIDERDVSLHRGFKEELKEIFGHGGKLPRIFANGRYMGGAEEVARMHYSGELREALQDCEVVAVGKGGSPAACEACGGVRFVPCENCSGSCKVYVAAGDGGFRRCLDCNENGLVRCLLCC